MTEQLDRGVARGGGGGEWEGGGGRKGPCPPPMCGEFVFQQLQWGTVCRCVITVSWHGRMDGLDEVPVAYYTGRRYHPPPPSHTHTPTTFYDPALPPTPTHENSGYATSARPHSQSWGQFRSGIGFSCQFQFRNWNLISFSQSDRNWN